MVTHARRQFLEFFPRSGSAQRYNLKYAPVCQTEMPDNIPGSWAKIRCTSTLSTEYLAVSHKTVTPPAYVIGFEFVLR